MPHPQLSRVGGLGLFATQKYTAGDLVIEEKFIFELPVYMCNTKKVNRAVESLNEAEASLFWALSDCQASEGSRPTTPSAMGILRTNALPASIDPICVAIFPTIARINHSCVPNVHHAWNERRKVEMVYAVCDIQPGEELFTCYLPDGGFGMTFAERQERLLGAFRFACACQACSLNMEGRQASDDRRLQLRSVLGSPQLACTCTHADLKERENKTVHDDPVSVSGRIPAPHSVGCFARCVELLELEHLVDPGLLGTCEFYAHEAALLANEIEQAVMWLDRACRHFECAEGPLSGDLDTLKQELEHLRLQCERFGPEVRDRSTKGDVKSQSMRAK